MHSILLLAALSTTMATPFRDHSPAAEPPLSSRLNELADSGLGSSSSDSFADLSPLTGSLSPDSSPMVPALDLEQSLPSSVGSSGELDDFVPADDDVIQDPAAKEQAQGYCLIPFFS